MIETAPNITALDDSISFEFEYASASENANTAQLFSEAVEAIDSNDYALLDSIVGKSGFDIRTKNAQGQTLFHSFFAIEFDDTRPMCPEAVQNRREMFRLLMTSKNATDAMFLRDQNEHTFLHTLFEHPSRVNNVLLHDIAQARPQLVKNLAAREAANGQSLISVGLTALSKIPEKRSLLERFSARVKAFATTLKIMVFHRFHLITEDEVDTARVIAAKIAAEMPFMTRKEKVNLLSDLGTHLNLLTESNSYLRQQILDKDYNWLSASLQKDAAKETIEDENGNKPSEPLPEPTTEVVEKEPIEELLEEETIEELNEDDEIEEISVSEITAQQHREAFRSIEHVGQIEAQDVTYAPEVYMDVNNIPHSGIEFLHEHNHVAQKGLSKFIKNQKQNFKGSPKVHIGLLGINERSTFGVKRPSHTVLVIHVNNKAIIVDSKFGSIYWEADDVYRTQLQPFQNHDDCTRYAVATAVELCKVLPNMHSMDPLQQEMEIKKAIRMINPLMLTNIEVDEYLNPYREKHKREYDEVTRIMEQNEEAKRTAQLVQVVV
ncbi:hypothetical protein [Parashewanella curva]|nr:hypothetical protein [Parashewanella curva]